MFNELNVLKDILILQSPPRQRIKYFIEKRIDEINSNNTVHSINHSAKIVLHIIPLSSIEHEKAYDLKNTFEGILNLGKYPLLSEPTEITAKRNFDGVAIFDKKNIENGYSQFFRNGIIEVVDTGVLDNKVIPPKLYEERIIIVLLNHLKELSTLDIEPPASIGVSLLGIKDFKISTDLKHEVMDRNDLILPIIELSDLSTDFKKISRLLKPAFDLVWQSCDMEGSQNYDEKEEWKHK